MKYTIRLMSVTIKTGMFNALHSNPTKKLISPCQMLFHAIATCRARMGKAHKNAGILYEVLCTVKKNEKIEEINPEVCV